MILNRSGLLEYSKANISAAPSILGLMDKVLVPSRLCNLIEEPCDDTWRISDHRSDFLPSRVFLVIPESEIFTLVVKNRTSNTTPTPIKKSEKHKFPDSNKQTGNNTYEQEHQVKHPQTLDL